MDDLRHTNVTHIVSVRNACVIVVIEPRVVGSERNDAEISTGLELPTTSRGNNTTENEFPSPITLFSIKKYTHAKNDGGF